MREAGAESVLYWVAGITIMFGQCFSLVSQVTPAVLRELYWCWCSACTGRASGPAPRPTSQPASQYQRY